MNSSTYHSYFFFNHRSEHLTVYNVSPYVAEDKMETMNLEDRTLTMRMSGCLISESYKAVKATITVSPKEDGEGSCVAWKVEFEKIRHDIEDPHLIIDTLIDVLVNYLKETDGNLLL